MISIDKRVEGFKDLGWIQEGDGIDSQKDVPLLHIYGRLCRTGRGRARTNGMVGESPRVAK